MAPKKAVRLYGAYPRALHGTLPCLSPGCGALHGVYHMVGRLLFYLSSKCACLTAKPSRDLGLVSCVLPAFSPVHNQAQRSLIYKFWRCQAQVEAFCTQDHRGPHAILEVGRLPAQAVAFLVLQAARTHQWPKKAADGDARATATEVTRRHILNNQSSEPPQDPSGLQARPTALELSWSKKECSPLPHKNPCDRSPTPPCKH